MEQLGPNQGPEEWINILRKQLYPISFSSNWKVWMFIVFGEKSK
jgi:hypothetical protein